ncbi:GntR family transcriptional regulator [Virgibacillus profundi]|uniref:GntR family transcriptional regulator n=1 Tax=Virgibacillus profundi TaxID=2024555 RepID=A0A2A2IFR8_9BACI|nr:GntR family transcriptional regulator [Virgibacillus profundi]PAV30841.1 GntR family transcriptional regulator [Virgibacillus profundi]PXY55024.1 GntR family transcriptional regulator [Virgibacillus profundi]
MKENQSIKQFVYNKIKEAILTRKLPPGKQLVEHTISRNLNVSRTPIRNAIDMLDSDGLIEIIPNRGAFVINPSIDEILQAYHLRKELEIMAVGMSINNLQKEDFIQMEGFIKEENEALHKKDVIKYLEANQNFHMAITKKCGNRFLIEFVDKLISRTSVYLILFDVFFEVNAPQAYGYKEHLEIIQLLKQKKNKDVENYLSKHFNNAIKSLDVQTEYKDLDSIF